MPLAVDRQGQGIPSVSLMKGSSFTRRPTSLGSQVEVTALDAKLDEVVEQGLNA